MTALTAVTPTLAGTVVAAGNVAASDTITATQLGGLGCLLEVINGNASSDTVAITDASPTLAGNSNATSGGVVTNGTSKVFYISPRAVNPATSLVTVTHSVTTTVTYKLYSLG